MELRYQLRKLLTAAGALLLFALPSPGQVQPSPIIPAQWFDNNGKILSGGCLATFQSGTTTPLATYSDAAGMNLNTNPVQLDSSGRATVFLQSQAYTLKLYVHGATNNCATSLGPLIWSIDGINPSANSILSTNNTWTGTNTWQSTSTFNGPTNFNVGFTSSGPNVLGGGGSMAGTYSGSPIFSGNPTFSGTPVVTGGFTFTVPWTSTVVTGTPAFSVASNTLIPNLNASLLESRSWESPAMIGSVTPTNGTFTGLHATTNFQIASGSLIGGTQGMDINLLTSGTIASGAGHVLCTSSNGGATTSGCPTAGFTQIATATLSPGCTTGGSSFDNCTDTLTWSGGGFADASYVPTCFGKDVRTSGASGTAEPPLLVEFSQSATTITVITMNLRGGISSVNFDTIFCSAIHP